MNYKLKQLFFEVLNTKEQNRSDIDQEFQKIPYLNGSLFNKTKIESEYDYKIKAKTIKLIIEFLDDFDFTHVEEKNKEIIDPEILGYIFEKSINEEEEKKKRQLLYSQKHNRIHKPKNHKSSYPIQN